MSANNSTKKLDIGFYRKPDGARWVYVDLLKYGPPYPRFIPSFRDLSRILQAIAECEDEKYPPPAKGRIRLLEFLRDVVNGADFERLAQKYKIPERDGDTVVNARGANVVGTTPDQSDTSKPPAPLARELRADDIPWGA